MQVNDIKIAEVLKLQRFLGYTFFRSNHYDPCKVVICENIVLGTEIFLIHLLIQLLAFA